MKCLRRPLVAVLAAAMLAGAHDAVAQQVVLVTLPAAVGFNVSNVGQSTVGNPSPSQASFVVVNLALFRVLRVAVKADADFVPPSGPAIPATNVSWSTSNATGVVPTDGTLSTVSYGQVFQMQNSLITAGSVDIQWTLAAPGTGIRAGIHSAVVRWRLESVVP